MKIKFLPLSIPGRLSILFGLLTPALFFIAFMVDSVALVNLTPFVALFWLMLAAIALIRRDWSILTVLSAAASLIATILILSEPWALEAIKGIF